MTHAGPIDPQQRRLHARLAEIRDRGLKATSWHSSAQHLRRLINRAGVVPVRTELARDDVEFLATAREDLLAFTELGLELAEMHRPRDGGGITSDPESPIRRCRACMRRWPCPTWRVVEEHLDQTD